MTTSIHTRARRYRLLALAAAPLALATAMPAVAQDPAATEASAEPVDDSEIVVTARRREENLLDVPISITAYSGAALERQGAIDITDLSDTTPNVTLENSRGTNSTLTAFIRGVGQQDPVPGFEAGVGIYLDDVYLNRPQASVLDIYDVERIEVLRGPQGTLYGRNTIGGAIKYVTRRLPDDLEIKLRATYGSYDQADGIASISVPLGTMFKIGGSVARLSRSGFGDNVNLDGVENYNKDVWAGRGTLEFTSPDTRLFARLTADYTKDKSDARNGHRLIPGLLGGAAVLDDVFDTRAGLNNPRQEVEAYGVAMNISAELTDNLTLRSISAYRYDDSFTPIDFDALPSIDVDVPARYTNDQLSTELQLVYEGERLNGLIGGYFLDANARVAFDVILGTTGTLIGVPGLNAFTFGDVHTETWSVFGDFTYEIFDTVSISLGGRYTNDRRDSIVKRQTLRGGTSAEFGGTATLVATTSDFEGGRTFKEFTPRGSISWKPSEDHTLYASYSKGFKGGGFDPRGQTSAAPDLDRDGVREPDEIFDFLSFDPETVDSYELGWKASLFDRRLRFSLAGFYADYTDVQIPGSVGVDANGDGVNESFIGVTTNAASAEIKGIELESFVVLARDLTGDGSSLNFAGTLGYIDAQYNEFIDAFGNDVADVRAIQNTPEWTLSGTLSYTTRLAEGRLDASTTVSYRSETNQFEVPSEFLDQPGYELWDASLSWSNDRFNFGLHARNILNKEYITSGYQFLAVDPDGTVRRNTAGNVISTLGREGIATAFYGNPRQVHVTAGVRF